MPKNHHEMSFRTPGVFAGRRNPRFFQHADESRFLATLRNDNIFLFSATCNRALPVTVTTVSIETSNACYLSNGLIPTKAGWIIEAIKLIPEEFPARIRSEVFSSALGRMVFRSGPPITHT
jgi:hypothetical protein